MSGLRLIVLSRLPRTGKSTLADGIGGELRLPVVSVDPLESAVLRAGIARSFETGLAAYLVAEAVVDHQLGLGLDVIVDAVNAVEPARDTWRELARRHGARMSVFVCVLDRVVAGARLRERNRGRAFRSRRRTTSTREPRNGRRGWSRTSSSMPRTTRRRTSPRPWRRSAGPHDAGARGRVDRGAVIVAPADPDLTLCWPVRSPP